MGSSVGPYSTTLILTVPYYDVAMYSNPDPWEDPKSRSLNGGSYKVPLVVWGPKLGDLLSRSSRGSGKALNPTSSTPWLLPMMAFYSE